MRAEAGNDMGREPFGQVARRAVLWLLFLAPLFYVSYGYANWLASQRPGVGSIVFGWEHYIPFMAWTIVPYWSINLFYGLSLLANPTRAAVDRLAGRYLTAQIVAVTCFILWPLTATFARPETTGLPGFLFAVLGGFDKPFNQAPSLHIALLVIIWDHWRHRLAGPAKAVWHVWCALIGLSVLTTWQHHFIDIPTGALLGLFALWLFPREGALPVSFAGLTDDPKRRKLGVAYAAGALILLAAAVAFGTSASPFWLLLLWPALALAIVALGYLVSGPVVFQKAADGTVSLASRWLLLPYRLGARLNVRAWTHRLPSAVEVAGGVHLGRFPAAADADAFGTVIDLTTEFEKPAVSAARWVSIPMLDLTTPPAQSRRAAVDAISAAAGSGKVLVCCALGFQRSASVVADWLVDSGRARDAAEARRLIAATGRPFHLSETRSAVGAIS